MATEQVVETTIFRLHNASWSSDMPLSDESQLITATQFIDMMKIIEHYDGFTQQFWGRIVEDSRYFVWCIMWESLHSAKRSEHRRTQEAVRHDLEQIFDLQAFPPLKIYSKFPSSAKDAFNSGATEIAFFTLPTERYHKDTKAVIDAGLRSATAMVQTVGKATGAAVGWVLDAQNLEIDSGQSIALHGVFGYATVEDHTKWRETPEHAQVLRDQAHLADLGLRPAKMPGSDIYVLGSGMFHVCFAQHQ